MSQAREEFDFVVVGAGSAGCVVASRLAEREGASVALLEAGARDRNIWMKVPVGYGKLFSDARYNWMDESAPEPGLNSRPLFQPRGRVLGGTGSLNGMLYVRGQAADYDNWRDLGNEGWGYDSVLPYFKKSEHQARGADHYHGTDGPIWVSDQPQGHPLTEALIGAAQECGSTRNDDFNAATQEGAGYFQTTTRDGVRCSSAAGFLRGLPRKGQLQLLLNALATRVIFEGQRAVAVQYLHAGRILRTVRARREVILCAGVFKTPQLLQVSGVGDASHVRSLGVHAVVHLPGVGQNLHDHFRGSFVFVCSQPVTHNDSMRNLGGRASAALQYAATRKGPLATGLYGGGFFRVSPEAKTPDVQVTLWTSSLARRDAKAVVLHDFSGFTMNAIVLRPKSRGCVLATSANMRDPAHIQFNYLTHPEDLATALHGMKLIRRLAAAPSLASYVESEYFPGPAMRDDAALEAHLRNNGGSTFHAVGTCAMGQGAMSVVDSKLRVRGVDGLRIADASVMPQIPSGNTNAPTVMIAERAAAFCLEEAPVPRARARC